MRSIKYHFSVMVSLIALCFIFFIAEIWYFSSLKENLLEKYNISFEKTNDLNSLLNESKELERRYFLSMPQSKEGQEIYGRWLNCIDELDRLVTSSGLLSDQVLLSWQESAVRYRQYQKSVAVEDQENQRNIHFGKVELRQLTKEMKFLSQYIKRKSAEELKRFTDRSNHIFRMSVYILVFVFLITLYSLMRFIRKILSDISDLEMGSAEIMKGNYEIDFQVISSTEFHELGNTFKKMSYLILDQIESLTKEKEKAEASANVKSEFLAVMSHEVRTPMNAINGMLDLMQDDSSISKTQASYLEVMKESSDGLLMILQDILDFSKIESGKLEIRMDRFNINSLLNGTANLYSYKLQKDEVAMDVGVSEKILNDLLGDSNRIRQVISNLLSNAVKFTEKGQIKVYADLEFDLTDRQKIKVSVADTGIGISEENQKKLFQEFSQADMSTTRKYGGIGLGLAIAKKLIEMMGGEIGVESQLGEGSTFWFKIDLFKAEDSANTKSLSGGDIRSPKPSDDFKFSSAIKDKMKVLIAEDNKINYKVLSKMLTKMKLEYDWAENGVEAVRMFSGNDYSFVLMDLKMPTMGGLEASSKIRELESLRKKPNRVPIIACTANVFEEDRLQCLEVGMDDFIEKPVNFKKLSGVIEKWAGATASEDDDKES